MIVWKIEVRGRGVEPYEFSSQREAKAFAEATYPWRGEAWRLFRERKAVASK
jgi:hypothetical protein